MFGGLDYHQPSLQQPHEHSTMQRNFNHVVINIHTFPDMCVKMLGTSLHDSHIIFTRWLLALGLPVILGTIEHP